MSQKKEGIEVEGKVINLQETVTMIAPKGGAFHKEGQEITIHPEQAKYLETKGYKIAAKK